LLVLPTTRSRIEYSPVTGHVAIITSRWQCQSDSLAGRDVLIFLLTNRSSHERRVIPMLRHMADSEAGQGH
ncbi:uncharacterized protein L969DRAFT_55751, partial [Mixia osmundae IAM 14324]|uniref:uncharacterized protein n=1 Tax=Mixia osmundae (strain CBS 9802 / IAM 14324 / JCM 22182 / KY 12970) TaxID=764103 RepID=UPI0004A55457